MDTSQPHITTNPEVCGGKPCIEGTTIKVTDIASALGRGSKVGEILEQYSASSVTRGQVYAALTYYEDHQDELAAVHAEELLAAGVIEKERLAAIKRRFMGQS